MILVEGLNDDLRTKLAVEDASCELNSKASRDPGGD
jgi:hypothetical protein